MPPGTFKLVRRAYEGEGNTMTPPYWVLYWAPYQYGLLPSPLVSRQRPLVMSDDDKPLGSSPTTRLDGLHDQQRKNVLSKYECVHEHTRRLLACSNAWHTHTRGDGGGGKGEGLGGLGLGGEGLGGLGEGGLRADAQSWGA